MDEIDEIVGEFLVESYENLDRFDEDLLALERDPTDTEVLSSIFRTIHTVKGTSGFFGFSQLESFAHVAENLLGKLRDGQLAVTEDIASALLATGDALRRMLTTIEADGAEGEHDVSALAATLTALQEPSADETADESPAEVVDGDTADAPPQPDARLGDVLVDRGAVDRDDVEVAAMEQQLGDERPLGEILVSQQAVAAKDVDEALETQARTRSVADTSIRVDVGLLDELMNLVGELVLARNQIVQLVMQDQDSAFAGASQRLNLISTELQEGVMKTRMQPIGNVWNKLPRVVRDLSLAVGKQVRLDMSGQDTELDKTIIEAIKDPLTHLVRNAVDHGIEAVEARVAAGKTAEGSLSLRAFHEGGQVNIEIADDGAGIDAAKLRAKAVEAGVLSADQAASLTERESLHLIFAAGFSTAKEVTNVSGRGVGMDVVRTNIERIGGTVDVHTELGVGTTFRIKIPLTLAIVPALIVADHGDRFAIPQLSLVELVRLEGEQARAGIEYVHGVPVHRLRGRLLPIVQLSDELGRERADLGEQNVINIVVLQADGTQFGLVVDDIHDTQEIVVKPLGAHLKDVTRFSGATIMGDGHVALILDVIGIAQGSRVVSDSRERAAQLQDEHVERSDDQRRTLLLVGLGEDRRVAISLSEVSRLEEFAASELEWAAGREVVQYRDRILPLVRLDETLGFGLGREPGSLNVVVHRTGPDGQDEVGLVVGTILDIVDHVGALDQGEPRHGLLGSTVIQGRVTDVLDADAVVGSPSSAYLGV